MRGTLKAMTAGLMALASALNALAADPTFRVGSAAPPFTAETSEGRRVSLADFSGKTVVLEWTNPDCPYVAKHYDGGNMQSLQRDAATKGVVWLTISSAAPGNVGYLDALEAAELLETRKAKPAHMLLDRDGKMMEAYGVSVALTMAVIDPKGVLAYHGAIDDKPTAIPKTWRAPETMCARPSMRSRPANLRSLRRRGRTVVRRVDLRLRRAPHKFSRRGNTAALKLTAAVK